MATLGFELAKPSRSNKEDNKENQTKKTLSFKIKDQEIITYLQTVQ